MINSKIAEVLNNPTNAGILRGANAIGRADGTLCKDIVKFYLIIENNKVNEAKFKCFGSAYLIAASSITADLLKAKTLDELTEFDISNVRSELGEVPEQFDYIFALVNEAVQNTLLDYYKKQEKEVKSNN